MVMMDLKKGSLTRIAVRWSSAALAALCRLFGDGLQSVRQMESMSRDTNSVCPTEFVYHNISWQKAKVWSKAVVNRDEYLITMGFIYLSLE